MSDPVLEVQGLSKRYQLGSISRHTLVDEVEHLLLKLQGKNPAQHMGKIGAAAPSDAKEFWALRDVSFKVNAGEVLGIIGGNGAGKSTLLKVLSRITEPTSGQAVIRGRVGSLLEVGTGFHPELTGRENVYMNGTLLGMKKREVSAKFDEIVAFSGVEQFIDTPVKRYSSGMYVRLAFAVAAHLEPEILIVDEVLAVGDVAFQKKCLGKMEDVARAGRTVLFVSHNLSALRTLCPRCILLDHGHLEADGPTHAVLQKYTGILPGKLRDHWQADSGRPSGFQCLEILQPGLKDGQVQISAPFEIVFRLINPQHPPGYMITAQIQTEEGQIVHHVGDLYLDEQADKWRKGDRSLTVPAHALAPGTYALTCWLWSPGKGLVDQLEQPLLWEVLPDGPGFAWHPPSQWSGCTGPGFLKWNLFQEQEDA